MMLSELRSYLRQQQRVALKDMATQFDIDTGALQGMLDKWISKGYVRKLPAGTACGSGCCQCDPALIELYEWVGKVE
jgi:putative ferrous iron transport protein C